MKKSCITLFGALGISASLSTMAGPDWQAVEQARKARHSGSATVAQTAETTKKLVLPLDHGPRAETTPWLNHQRMQRLLAKEAEDLRMASTVEEK